MAVKKLMIEDENTEMEYRLSFIDELPGMLKTLTKKVNLLMGEKDSFNPHVKNNVLSARDHLYEALQDMHRAMNATSLGKKKNESLKEEVSNDDVRELVLYITNKADLYPQIKSVIANMKRKRKANKYDDELAVKAWQYVADAGVKMYDKEYGSGKGSLTFLDKPTRKEIAVQLRDYYDEDLFEED